MMLSWMRMHLILLAIVGLIATVGVQGCERRSNVRLLHDIGSQKDVLSNLLKANNIKNLPDEMLSSKSGWKMDVVEGNTRAGAVISVIVVYPAGGLGERGYSFVFNARGVCLLSSRDSTFSSDGGLVDVTRDGYAEKVVAFHEDNAMQNGWKSAPDRLQVYSFTPGRALKLLDVRFNFARVPGDAEYFVPMLDWGGRSFADILFLDVDWPEQRFDDTRHVRFLWGLAEQRFEQSKYSENIEVVFPAASTVVVSPEKSVGH